MSPYIGMRLYNVSGHRLYLTAGERDAFGKATEKFLREVCTYCHTLLYTGCRPSEALALTADRVDFASGTLTFGSLKKRRNGMYRAVPVPLASSMRSTWHTDSEAAEGNHTGVCGPGTARRHTAVSRRSCRPAGIEGPQASPKGLRHGFGVSCIEKHIPLNMVQKWLGHASLTTTSIYANAVGEEERNIAARLWE